MAVLCIEDMMIAKRWRVALQAEIPDLDVRIWPDVGDPADIEMALFWDELEPLNQLPNLKIAVVLGAGADHLFEPELEIPERLSIVRLIDPSIIGQMVEYVVMTVTIQNRRWNDYQEMVGRKDYEELDAPVPCDVTIGVLGLGEIGKRAARSLAMIGYRVVGWSRSPRRIEGVTCFHGDDGLHRLLEASNVVVCLLPLTNATRNILNAGFFAAMKRGAYLINAARGGHLVESDLIAAIDSGHLSGATLDVQRSEPPSHDHPFWNHSKIVITPHIASITSPEHSAAPVAENYRRFRAGEPLLNVIDTRRQY